MPIIKILNHLASGNFELTWHAEERMQERNIRFRDIQSVGQKCTKWKQQSPEKFKIWGLTLDGDEIAVVCAYDGTTLIITVMGG